MAVKRVIVSRLTLVLTTPTREGMATWTDSTWPAVIGHPSANLGSIWSNFTHLKWPARYHNAESSVIYIKAEVTTTIQLRFDSIRRPIDCQRSLRSQWRNTGRWPASRSHADLFIYLGLSATTHTQIGLCGGCNCHLTDLTAVLLLFDSHSTTFVMTVGTTANMNTSAWLLLLARQRALLSYVTLTFTTFVLLLSNACRIVVKS